MLYLWLHGVYSVRTLQWKIHNLLTGGIHFQPSYRHEIANKTSYCLTKTCLKKEFLMRKRGLAIEYIYLKRHWSVDRSKFIKIILLRWEMHSFDTFNVQQATKFVKNRKQIKLKAYTGDWITLDLSLKRKWPAGYPSAPNDTYNVCLFIIFVHFKCFSHMEALPFLSTIDCKLDYTYIYNRYHRAMNVL